MGVLLRPELDLAHDLHQDRVMMTPFQSKQGPLYRILSPWARKVSVKPALVILICLVLSPLSTQAKIKSSTFIQQIRSHRARVIALASLVVQHFPDEFAGLSHKIIFGYLKLHDQPKIQNLAQLRAHGYRAGQTLATRLAEFYGSNLNDLPEADRARLRQIIDTLNEIEWREKQDFFKKYDLSSKQVQKLAWLEHIVDVTDTGIWRRSELDLDEDPYDGERFLVRAGDRHAGDVSHWLEDQLLLGARPEANCPLLF